ncbi:MAG: endonuclease MutS2 [Oscillospiraceae bacterium]
MTAGSPRIMEEIMGIIQKHIHSLELDKILARLAEEATCEDSHNICLKIQPQTSYPQVVRDMEKTLAAHSLTGRFGTPTVLDMKNCEGAIKRAEIGSQLTPVELLRINGDLKAIRNLKQWSEHFSGEENALTELFTMLYPQRKLEDTINNAIVSEDEIADNASRELADIRRKIIAAGQKVRNHLDGMIRSQSYQKYLQDSIITMRDGRFVVPVKSEYRNEVSGLVHDTSSSGATLFIEPMGVVEANNEIRVLKNKEKQEIDRILAEISAEVGDCGDLIKASYNVAVEIDVILSKARLAWEMNCAVVDITNDGKIHLVKARHPLIDKDKVVPTNIDLGNTFDTLVITGPNTGGKTVVIKTLGLLTLMAMCGLMLPVSDGSQISVFNNVLVDIGDEQSIEQSLSTFSGHMTNIVSIMNEVDDKSLVLVDELGAGTDPVEGAALAVSIIEHLRSKGAKIAATTHYPEIKMYALETAGVENGSCEFDVATLRPTYRLLIGVPGRSNAFAISSRLGLCDSIIDRAKELVSTENTRFEDVVAKLERSRQEMEDARIEAESQRTIAKRTREEIETHRQRLEDLQEKEIDKARIEARRIVESVTIQSQNMMDELDEIRKARENEDFVQMASTVKGQFKANLRKLQELADPVTKKKSVNYAPPRPLVKGDSVMVVELNKEGKIISNPDGMGMVTVQSGIIKTRVKVNDLRLIERKKGAQENTQTHSFKGTSVKNREPKMELNLRGMAADEAILELDRFIDDAVMSHLTTIHIIHGKGTGVLRAAVQSHLRQNKAIKSFRLGVYGEGESGVTVAELK